MVSKKTTIRDIAAATGASIATVSRALQNKPGVSEELREELRRAAVRLNYVPKKAKDQRQNLLLILPSSYLQQGSAIYSKGLEILYPVFVKIVVVFAPFLFLMFAQ